MYKTRSASKKRKNRKTQHKKTLVIILIPHRALSSPLLSVNLSLRFESYYVVTFSGFGSSKSAYLFFSIATSNHDFFFAYNKQHPFFANLFS